ncbi:MAG: hypothetical protein R3D27_09785 [Hyphomicrobiaceae bacterium]
MQDISNSQRALWTFLMFTLAGPFLGALAVAGALILAPVFKLAALLPPSLPPVGASTVTSFVWSAIPATLAAIALVPMVLRRGTFGWVAAAAAGVVAVAAASVIFPLAHPELRFVLMVLAGIVAVGLRQILAVAGIIR